MRASSLALLGSAFVGFLFLSLPASADEPRCEIISGEHVCRDCIGGSCMPSREFRAARSEEDYRIFVPGRAVPPHKARSERRQ